MNNAMLTGVLSLALIVFLFKDYLSQNNQMYVLSLTLVYTFVGGLRTFGILLELESLKKFSLDIFKIFIPALTAWIMIVVLFSELVAVLNGIDLNQNTAITRQINVEANVVGIYAAFVVLIIILNYVYHIVIEFRYPIRFHRNSWN